MSHHQPTNLRWTWHDALSYAPVVTAIGLLALLASQEPLIVAALLVVVTTAALLVASPLAAVSLMVLVLPLVRWGPYVGFYLRPYYIVALLVLVLCVWYWASGRLRGVRLNMADLGVVAFLACCLLSFTVSTELDWSIRKLMSLVWVGMVYLALRVVIQTRAALRTALITGGISMGTFAVGGMAVMALFVQRGVFEDLLYIHEGLGQVRLSYLHTDPNHYGLHVGVYLIFTLVFMLLEPRSRMWAKWLLLILLASNLLMAFSRGAFLALAAVLPLIMISLRGHISRKVFMRALVVTVAATVVVMMVVYLSVPQWIWALQWERLVATVHEVMEGRDPRLPVFAAAWGNFVDHPLLGVGLGVSRTWGWQHAYAHSLALEILQDAGLVGMAGYVLMVGAVVGMGLRVYRRSRDPFLRAVAIAALYALLFFHLQTVFTINAMQDVMLWALMGLIVATALIAQRQASHDATSPEDGGEPAVAAR